MTKEEFIKKAKELYWSNEQINETILLKEEAERDGVNIPYELGLENNPID